MQSMLNHSPAIGNMRLSQLQVRQEVSTLVSGRAATVPCRHRQGVQCAVGASRGGKAQLAPARISVITPASGGGLTGGGAGVSGGGGDGGGGDGGASPSSHPMRGWTFFLAALLAVGGAVGYAKKGSAKSLGGGLSGAFIMALAARSMTGPSMHAGARVAFGVCLLLGVFFVSRFASSRKVFPAGVGAGLTLGYAAGYVATGL